MSQERIEKLPKWAQEYIETLEHERRKASAFRWTDPSHMEPDVPVPDSFKQLAKGWLFNDYIALRRGCSAPVERACSSRVSHAYGRDDKTTTQQPRKLYSTRLRALKALRVALENRCAEVLANLDAEIEKEQG